MSNNYYRELLIEAWEKEEQLINLINECLERIYPDMKHEQTLTFKRELEKYPLIRFIPHLPFYDIEAMNLRNRRNEKKTPCD